MGNPEAEKEGIVDALRLPAEEVSQDIGNARTGDFGLIDRQHFGRSIDGGNRRCAAQQLLRPGSRPSGQFEHVSCQMKGMELGKHLIPFSEPAGIELWSLIVAPLAVEDCIVLAGTGLIVTLHFFECLKRNGIIHHSSSPLPKEDGKDDSF